MALGLLIVFFADARYWYTISLRPYVRPTVCMSVLNEWTYLKIFESADHSSF